MNATLVRDFFLGKSTAPQLAQDLRDGHEFARKQTRSPKFQDLDKDFALKPEHLVRLCDSVIDGSIAPESLEEIACGIIASDHFDWDSGTPDGWRVGEALYDWASPDVNYALTMDTARKFRDRLITGNDTFTRADFVPRLPNTR